MIDELLHTSALFDLYGGLLTKKQQKCLRMHLFDDFSLSEIGDEMGITRQAAHDMIKRSGMALEEYEEKLGFLKKVSSQRDEFDRIYEKLNKAEFVNVDEKTALLKDILPFTNFEQEDET